jgi:hypothetical protein
MSRPSRQIAALAGVLAALGALAAAPASAEMRSEKISKHLCKTTGGGKFVDIPGFPGERIDRRLIRDIRWMKRKYRIFITDGYAPTGHAPNGEHPIGLAADIVPRPNGGRWGLIGDLAHRFEPRQNQVRAPMRWVGWNGDAGHGRGDHLHLSWMHSQTPPRDPARVVYTRKCPGETADRDRGGGGGSGGSGGGGSGGISPKRIVGAAGLTPGELAGLAPVVVEPG